MKEGELVVTLRLLASWLERSTSPKEVEGAVHVREAADRIEAARSPGPATDAGPYDPRAVRAWDEYAAEYAPSDLTERELYLHGWQAAKAALAMSAGPLTISESCYIDLCQTIVQAMVDRARLVAENAELRRRIYAAGL